MKTIANSILLIAALFVALAALTPRAFADGGIPLWTNFYHGPGQHYDSARGVAVDSSGNVFVTGESYGTSSYDYATVGYSNTGLPLWTNRYNGLVFGDYFAYAVAADSSGNAFV